MRHKIYSLLRRSERLFKTDMVYLAKGGFWVTIGQGVSTVAGFGLAVAFANLLSATTYGTYQFVLSVVGILSATTLTGLNTAAVRSIARGAEGVIGHSLKTKLRWGSLGSLGSLLIGIYYTLQNNLELGVSFFIVAAFIPFFYSLGISGALLQGKKLFKTNVKYNVFNQLFTTIIIVSALLLTNSLFVVLFAYFAAWTLARLFVFISTVKKHRSNNVNDPEIISYGKHLSVMGVISTIADNIDKLLIFHFIGAVEVAIYSLAIAPVMQLKGLLKNVNTLALPKLSLRTKGELQDNILKRSFMLILVSLPIVLAYVAVAPFIYQTFFPNYLESITYSRVFVFAVMFTAAGSLASASLEAQMEIKKKYALTFFSKISKIILMILLAYYYGVWGVVFSVLINVVITTVVGVWLVRK